jgi:hypothetical protein
MLLELTIQQRDAIRAIAQGKLGEVPIEVVLSLKQLGLLRFDGQSMVLTADGRALSHWCR